MLDCNYLASIGSSLRLIFTECDSLFQMWVFTSLTCSSASILHLCAIALDRYRAMARPFAYQVLQTLALHRHQ